MKETIEDAAEKYVEINVAKYVAKLLYKEHFVEGAKWQKERSYSEEDMLESFMAGIKCESKYGKNFEQFIKQFKKK